MDVRRLNGVVTGSPFVLVSLVLVAVRFLAPTLSAALAIAGVDTKGIDSAFELYAGFLPAVLFAFAGLLIASWPGGFPRSRWLLLTILLILAVVAQWFGQLNPSLRLLAGSFVGSVLDGTVAAAILALYLFLDCALVERNVPPFARDGFRALGLGYALSYAFHAFRLIDYSYVFGWSIPSGLLWLLDYGPVIVLSFLSVYFWFELAVRPGLQGRVPVVAFAPPVAVAALGLAASGGLGGFILSNALAWGGSYLVFSPTSVSLSIVGFAVGAFLSVAWRLRAGLPRPTWGLVVGGVSVAACAGILSFGGTLPSLAGIALGLSLVARGLGTASASGTTTVVTSDK